ncbi:hypothetical protein KL950_000803 [Ogataea haglerorum]|uniref:Uncharacterized protein n=1 Tax=Ogataea haglerorum TaxID=1937702 RepID=A0ABQ7RKR8_9ASCO|nr:hypothetical protein KL950_000803 [Ogataea haglerorum]KAG7755178.1 hypothetical protein KL947_004366 [Ogataea haglerorum]KAG7767884.1 hypothetical protein KL946_000702 [Ogataea haglerorum]
MICRLSSRLPNWEVQLVLVQVRLRGLLDQASVRIRMSLVIAPARCQTLCRCDVAATDLEHVGDFRLGNNTMSDAPVQHNTAPRPMLCNRKYTAIRVELY